MVQFQEFSEGEWVNHKLHIPSANISGQFTGQQFCVGARNVDIAVQRHSQRIDALFPALYFLDLVKKQIRFSLDALCPFYDLIMQSRCGLQMGVPHIFKID